MIGQVVTVSDSTNHIISLGGKATKFNIPEDIFDVLAIAQKKNPKWLLAGIVAFSVPGVSQIILIVGHF